MLEKYKTSSGETLLFKGCPNKNVLDKLALAPGDLWHSSLDYGFQDCFPELVYQTAVFWWFLNDFTGEKQAVNWRMDIDNFVVRESVWEQLNGVDEAYEGEAMRGLDFGFRLLRFHFGIPLYVKGLFVSTKVKVTISTQDRYRFFSKYFKPRHSYYMLMRQGIFRCFKEYKALKRMQAVSQYQAAPLPLRPLQPIKGQPSVSVVIPTMKRQAYTELLLRDYNAQTYPIKEAVIVDATPEAERDTAYYQPESFNFDIKLKWQTTKGSCRARNEAIEQCTGDYIIFADDDVRILPDFVENHIILLQTYGVQAANGLDIMASHRDQDLNDLRDKLNAMGSSRWRVGVSHMFSNANAIVSRSLVGRLMGNDVNFDGGYGEDADFGLRILKAGEVLLFNPHSPNLHLKPPQGGYRFWGNQARMLGKRRKAQPWELDRPVRWVRPVPSPTVTYGIIKHFDNDQIKEWRYKYMFTYLFKGSRTGVIWRLMCLPFKQLRFSRSLAYARRLKTLGPRY